MKSAHELSHINCKSSKFAYNSMQIRVGRSSTDSFTVVFIHLHSARHMGRVGAQGEMGKEKFVPCVM